MTPDELERLLEREKALKEKIRDAKKELRKKEAKEDRRRDTRRKILAGAWILKLAQDHDKTNERLMAFVKGLDPKEQAVFADWAGVPDGWEPDPIPEPEPQQQDEQPQPQEPNGIRPYQGQVPETNYDGGHG